jgi:hypothetical protein
VIDTASAAPQRRIVLQSGLAVLGAALLPGRGSAAVPMLRDVDMPRAPVIPARPLTSPRVVRPELMKRALTALGRHADAIPHHDRIAIADFAAPSGQARLHIVDIVSGASSSFLVAHGSGSDPSHSGWLQRFSNDPGSNASCEGAFLASDYYVGHHGRSQRLHGLDETNSNALARAIVVHSAWYSNPEMLRTHGMLGRSQGCFAVGEQDLATVFDRLGQGRMIFSAKV